HTNHFERVFHRPDHIVEFVIVVDDADDTTFSWHLVTQPGHHRIKVRSVRCHCCYITLAPAFDLTSDITFRFAKVTESCRLEIYGVQFPQHIKKFEELLSYLLR